VHTLNDATAVEKIKAARTAAAQGRVKYGQGSPATRGILSLGDMRSDVMCALAVSIPAAVLI